MTDKNLSDKVQEIATAMRAAMRRDTPGYTDGEFLADMSRYVRDLENLSPDPPLPTMADMSMEERASCRWMQADVEGRSTRYVIAVPHVDDNEVTLIGPDGEIDWVFPEYVTPRPDLPPLEWPGTEEPDPAPALPDGWRLADHVTHGRVIVTSPTPDTEGDVYFVAPDPDPTGYDWHRCSPDRLTYIDQ